MELGGYDSDSWATSDCAPVLDILGTDDLSRSDDNCAASMQHSKREASVTNWQSRRKAYVDRWMAMLDKLRSFVVEHKRLPMRRRKIRPELTDEVRLHHWVQNNMFKYKMRLRERERKTILMTESVSKQWRRFVMDHADFFSKRALGQIVKSTASNDMNE